MNAYCCMSGQDYYCKITAGGRVFEHCRNDKYYFVVDHLESAIAVKKSTDAQKQVWDISKIDSLIHLPGVKIAFKDIGNGEGEYEITMKDIQWNRLKLVFHKSDFTLEKVNMYSSAKGKMYGASYSKPMIAMYYSGYSEKQVDKSFFDESKFFYEGKEGLVLSDAYKKYKLLDYIYKLSKRS